MQQALRRYFAALAVLWIILCIAAYFYSDAKQVPWGIALGVLPAFLLEAALYAACGVPAFRDALTGVEVRRRAGIIAGLALLPYLLYSLPGGLFSLPSFGLLLLLVGASTFWFVVLPRNSASDVLYLLVLATPILAKTFADIYVHPISKLQVFILGVVMWYRTSLLSILTIRKMDGIGFGFFPTSTEWWIGTRNFLLFLPAGLALSYGLQFARVREQPLTWQLVAMAVATFFGILWILALAEEFFFRGYLQQLLTRTLRNGWLALAASSLIFGAAHLGFRSQFPNWQFAGLATIAGVFYGLSFRQALSIRAAMVTHSFVVTTWRIFLV